MPFAVISNIIRAACTSPSGAHLQPWTFAVVHDADTKQQIREVVERQEVINYEKVWWQAILLSPCRQRMGKKWVADVAPLVSKLHEQGVSKPYLTDAPYLLVLLKQTHGIDKDGNKNKHWYPSESTGIAAGILIAAIHNANLVTLTSTPLGADAEIREILQRPNNEKVFLLLPVGFPAADATVPYRSPQTLRKPLSETMILY